MDRSDFDIQQNDEAVDTFRTIREALEALGIALILAFLFKAYIIEVYVIPTGSMASTLMGRHKDVNCEVCGFPFQLSASQESNDGRERQRARNELPRVIGGTCPQCQFTMYLGADNLAGQTYLSFGGDRIFVNRSLFTYREPSRWHVTVFHYPAAPQTNYIKRLIGLENETVMLRNGQVFVQKKGSDHFEIQRKPLRALLAMLRPVDDNDYVLPAIHELGWKPRWDGNEYWQRSADYKSFTGTGTQETSWLKFRYITPTTVDWYQLLQGKLPEGGTGTPQLITDSLDYNTQITRSPSETRREEYRLETPQSNVAQMLPRNPEGIGLNWVGDLVIRCTLNIEKSESKIVFNLVKGGINFQCLLWFDSNAAFATFSIPEVPDFEPFSVKVPIRPGHNHDVMFCNVDEEMRLMIDGKEIDTQNRGRYDALCAAHDLDGGALSRDRSPTELDLETPAAIGIQGNTTVHVNHLKIMRNMYYISCDYQMDARCDLIDSPFRLFNLGYEEEVKQILSSRTHLTKFGKTRKTTFKLDKDQFLMCGDNSAQSLDSRLWTIDGIPHYVERKYLIGEALYVWWPHGLRFPGTPLAVIPNLKKMRWID